MIPRFVLLLCALVFATSAVEAAPRKKKGSKKAAPAAEISLDLPLEAPPEEELPLEALPVETVPAAPVEPPPPEPGLVEVLPEEPLPVPEEPAQASFAGPRLRVTPVSGFGWTAESALGAATPVFNAGIGTAFRFTRDSSLALDFSDQLYTRRYLTTRPSFGGSAPFVELSEQKLAVDLLYGHELLRPFGVKDERFALQANVGPSARFFLNDALRSQAAGVAVGGRFTFAPSEQLDVSVGGAWTWNLLPVALGPPAVQLNAFGDLKSWSALEGSIGFTLAPRTRVRLGYAGEILTLASSYRLFHTLSFAFDVNI